MARMASIIDLSSSPEPSSHARTKSKSNQIIRRTCSVVELTDSDSDTASTKKPSVAGPSFLQNKSAALLPKTASSVSFENIPRKLKPSTSRPFPLFLPSDEENEPPPSSFVSVSPLPERSSFDLIGMDDIQPVEIVDPPTEVDPTMTYVARVLEIIPDIDPDHLLDLVTKNIPTRGDQVVEHVLHGLFENPTYPKVDKVGKGKRRQLDGDGEEIPLKKTKVDYGNKDRPYKGGVHYADIALVLLPYDFIYLHYFLQVYIGTSTNRLSVYTESISQDDTCKLQRVLFSDLLFPQRSGQAT
jgi:E3 ubiquitin-protein ligase RNF216